MYELLLLTFPRLQFPIEILFNAISHSIVPIYEFDWKKINQITDIVDAEIKIFHIS